MYLPRGLVRTRASHRAYVRRTTQMGGTRVADRQAIKACTAGPRALPPPCLTHPRHSATASGTHASATSAGAAQPGFYPASAEARLIAVPRMP
jgi:hypothetical protein